MNKNVNLKGEQFLLRMLICLNAKQTFLPFRIQTNIKFFCGLRPSNLMRIFDTGFLTDLFLVFRSNIDK